MNGIQMGDRMVHIGQSPHQIAWEIETGYAGWVGSNHATVREDRESALSDPHGTPTWDVTSTLLYCAHNKAALEEWAAQQNAAGILDADAKSQFVRSLAADQ